MTLTQVCPVRGQGRRLESEVLVPHSLHAGDLVSGRYRLEDLLTESAGGRFWRASDIVLERHVGVHLIGGDDPRAAGLISAARVSADHHDRRILRVLDADQTDSVSYVVNEWGNGTSLDLMLVAGQPLSARRAAWLVSEVADSLCRAHESGLVHGRMVPENVLIDYDGQVRIIGFGVDAALHGLPPGDEVDDLVNTVGVLYAALTTRWAGRSTSKVPRAPSHHDRVLRPRQVRAGVPKQLDIVCDEVLNAHPHPRSGHDLSTLSGIQAALADFVGDSTGIDTAASWRQLQSRAPLPWETGGRPMSGGSSHQSATDHEQSSTLQPTANHDTGQASAVDSADGTSDPVQSASDPASNLASEPGRVDEQAVDEPPAVATATSATPTIMVPSFASDSDEQSRTPDDTASTQTVVRPEAPAGPPQRDPDATEAGLPIFEESGDVGWVSAATHEPTPPPDLDQPDAKPLFAPAPKDGEPVRRPRPGTAAANANEFWPWDSTGSDTGSHTGSHTGSGVLPPYQDPSLDPYADGDESDAVPGRRSFRVAMLVGLSVLLLLIAAAVFHLRAGAGEDLPKADGDDASPRLTAYTGLSATDFDPQGSEPREESPELVAYAVDGKADTSWRTATYKQNLGPAGLKTGVGLVVDLGATKSVRRVDVETVGGPTALSVYVTSQAPTGVVDLTPVGTGAHKQQVNGTVTVTPGKAVSGRYVTIWLTSLPSVGDGFRGSVAEVRVLG